MIDPTCTGTRHGTRAANNHYGCTCPQARAEGARYTNQLRLEQLHGKPRRTVDATGTQRRLQALMALGWPQRTLATDLGYASPQSITELLRQTRVRLSTANRVAALYARLSDHPGPSDRTRRHAKSRGWAPPICWDDDTIDEPSASPDYGQKVPRKQALHEDATELMRLGYTREQAATRLGITDDYLRQILFLRQRKAGAA